MEKRGRGAGGGERSRGLSTRPRGLVLIPSAMWRRGAASRSGGDGEGVRPRSGELTRRGEDDKGRGGLLGRWTDSAGWASGPRPLGSRGGFLSFCFLFTFYLFFFSVLFLVSLLFCFSKIPKWHLICCYQICHNHKKFHPKII